MAKEKETTEVIEETEEMPMEVVEKETFKEKVLRHKNKILAGGAIVAGGTILAKLANHGRRIFAIENYLSDDPDDNDGYDPDDESDSDES